MQEVFRAIGRLSQSHVTVLITGESGTGKELVARALHRHSPRAAGPFVAINTAAIPKDLLESELFGHERGAFTGAQSSRRGRFEQAEGGTLFLDEIGDMPPDLQVRLLRVLADGEYYRVGGHAPLKANVRIIAATHQNLEERVRQGLFREDLMHRLNVVRLRLPPLRERAEDIAPLARQFLQKSARELAVEPKQLTDAGAQGARRTFAFPGNVRQLENICHWLTVMAPGQKVDVGDLPPEVRTRAGRERARRREQLAAGARSRTRAGARARRARRRRPAREGIRAHADRARAGAHRRPPDGSCAVAGLGPQHADAQDPGTGARRREALEREAATGRRRIGITAAAPASVRSTISSMTMSGAQPLDQRRVELRRRHERRCGEKFSASIGISGIAIESRYTSAREAAARRAAVDIGLDVWARRPQCRAARSALPGVARTLPSGAMSSSRNWRGNPSICARSPL